MPISDPFNYDVALRLRNLRRAARVYTTTGEALCGTLAHVTSEGLTCDGRRFTWIEIDSVEDGTFA